MTKKQFKKYLKKYRIWIFIVMFALLGAGAIYASYAATPPKYSIIVVAGQSNADGAESYVSDPANGFDLFGGKGNPADADTSIFWTNLTKNVGPPPVALKSIGTTTGQYTSSQATFGPEVGLARGLYDQGRRNVIVLKVSFGGLSLGAKPDAQDWNIHSSNEAYSILVNRMKLLQNWVKSQGGTASVDGFYWVQGEGDTNPTLAPLYENNLREFVTRARIDMGMSPGAPFVIAKTSIAAWIQTAQNLMGNCGGTTCAQLAAADSEVRSAQQKVADSVPGSKAVDTLGLPRHGLQMHLSNIGELQLGALFAKASASAAANNPTATKPNSTSSPSATSTAPTTKSSTRNTTSGSSTSGVSSIQASGGTESGASQTSTGGVRKSSDKSPSVWQRIRNFFSERINSVIEYLAN